MQLYVIAEDRYIQGKYSTLNETKFKVISFKYKKVDPKGRKCIVYWLLDIKPDGMDYQVLKNWELDHFSQN